MKLFAGRTVWKSSQETTESVGAWDGNLDVDEARDFLRMALLPAAFVVRRVDSHQFVGVARMKQRTSFDMEVPSHVKRAIQVSGSAPIPLMQVRKTPLLALDVTTDTQEVVSVLSSVKVNALVCLAMLDYCDDLLKKRIQTSLTRDRGGEYTAACGSLVDLIWPSRPRATVGGASILDSRLDWDSTTVIQRSIVRVVGLDASSAAKYLAYFSNAPEGTLAQELWSDDLFRQTMQRLAEHSFLAVHWLGTNDRAVVKVSFEAVVVEGRLLNPGPRVRSAGFFSTSKFLIMGLTSLLWNVFRKVCVHLGLLPFSVWHEAYQAADARSFHVEVIAPDGMKIKDACWLLKPPRELVDEFVEEVARISTPPVGKDIMQQLMGKAAPRRRVLHDLGPVPVRYNPDLSRSHSKLHSSVAGVPQGYGAIFTWRFVPGFQWIYIAFPIILGSLLLQAFFLSSGLKNNPTFPGWFPEHLALRMQASCESVRTFMYVVADVFGWRGKPVDSVLMIKQVSDDGLAAILLQNRATLVIGYAALAGALLVRAGEPPITRRLLAGPRLLVSLVVVLSTFSAAPLFLREWHLKYYTLLVWTTLAVSVLAAGLLSLMLVRVIMPFSRILRLLHLGKKALDRDGFRRLDDQPVLGSAIWLARRRSAIYGWKVEDF